jgi:hypothetical protein
MHSKDYKLSAKNLPVHKSMYRQALNDLQQNKQLKLFFCSTSPHIRQRANRHDAALHQFSLRYQLQPALAANADD